MADYRKGSPLDTLDKSLRATNVLSKDYRATILCHAEDAYREGIKQGIKDGEERARGQQQLC